MTDQRLRDELQARARDCNVKSVLEILAAACREEGGDREILMTTEDRKDLAELADELQALAGRTYV